MCNWRAKNSSWLTVGSPHPRTENDQWDKNGTNRIQPPAVATKQGRHKTESVDEQVIAVIGSQDISGVILRQGSAVQVKAQFASCEKRGVTKIIQWVDEQSTRLVTKYFECRFTYRVQFLQTWWQECLAWEALHHHQWWSWQTRSTSNS